MSKKPLAIFSRHTLLDGYPFGHALAPGDPRGNSSLGGWPHNLGDVYVAQALANLVDCDEYYVLTRGASRRAFDFVNSECAAVIVLAQNTLRYGWFEEHLPVEYLKKVNIPMVLVSLGVQFRFHEEIQLSHQDQESLRVLHANSDSSQVRGEISGKLLADSGITNTRVLGCPSILAADNPIKPVSDTRKLNSAYMLTDMGAIPDIHSWQFQLMEVLNSRSEMCRVVCQGGEYVLQDFVRARDGNARVRAAITVQSGPENPEPETLVMNRVGMLEDTPHDLVKISTELTAAETLEESVRWYYRECSPSLLESLVKFSIAADSVGELRRHVRAMDFVLSSRLHGGILALNEGTPTAFAVHDYRLKELVELYGLPFVEFGKDESLESLLEGDLEWPNMQALRGRLMKEFKNFFEANGIPHRLG